MITLADRERLIAIIDAIIALQQIAFVVESVGDQFAIKLRDFTVVVIADKARADDLARRLNGAITPQLDTEIAALKQAARDIFDAN